MHSVLCGRGRRAPWGRRRAPLRKLLGLLVRLLLLLILLLALPLAILSGPPVCVRNRQVLKVPRVLRVLRALPVLRVRRIRARSNRTRANKRNAVQNPRRPARVSLANPPIFLSLCPTHRGSSKRSGLFLTERQVAAGPSRALTNHRRLHPHLRPRLLWGLAVAVVVNAHR